MKRIREAMFEPRPRADAAFDAAVWHDLMRATVELPANCEPGTYGNVTDADGEPWEGKFFNGKYDNGRAFVSLR